MEYFHLESDARLLIVFKPSEIKAGIRLVLNIINEALPSGVSKQFISNETNYFRILIHLNFLWK